MVQYCILLAVLFVGGLAFPAHKDDSPRLEDHLNRFFNHGSSKNIDGRIVGGSVAAVGSYPWMVAITTGFMTRIFLCGGSLITNRHILTAAHCTDAIMGSGQVLNTRIVTGTNIWNMGGTVYSLRLLGNHPQYNPTTRKNDIGFIATANVIVLNNLVRSIPISYDNVSGGIPVRVSGWGWLSPGGTISNDLHELRLNTFDGESCVAEVTRVSQSLGLYLPRVDPKVEICTLVTVNFGICIGDGGSPLVRHSNNNLIGIASWGVPCARGAPDMFTRVSVFRDYIQDMVNLQLP